MDIRIDCYFAVLKKFKAEYPDAHFEVITRTAGSHLSPSRKLLNRYKALPMTFKEYTKLLRTEILMNKWGGIELIRLRRIAREKTVFLVCYEKDPTKCHRSVIKDMMTEVGPIE